MSTSLSFIGHISTPYVYIKDCPRNISPDGPECKITIDKSFESGLRGLSEGDHILILYWLAEAKRDYLEDGKKGTFALRTPHRPNPIGAAVVPIIALKGNVIIVRGLDCLTGTALLDIKPAIYKENNQ